MGITKQQLLNSVQQVKDYVDQEIEEIPTGSEITYTDQEISEAVAGILNPTPTQS